MDGRALEACPEAQRDLHPHFFTDQRESQSDAFSPALPIGPPLGWALGEGLRLPSPRTPCPRRHRGQPAQGPGSRRKHPVHPLIQNACGGGSWPGPVCSPVFQRPPKGSQLSALRSSQQAPLGKGDPVASAASFPSTCPLSMGDTGRFFKSRELTEGGVVPQRSPASASPRRTWP